MRRSAMTGPGEQDGERLSRRELLRKGLAAGAAVLCARTIEPSSARAPVAGEARRLGTDVHLFLDDALIASQRNLQRTIHPPRRLPRPIVTAREDRCFQPYVSVLLDPQTRRFRMWYNSADSSTQSRIGYLESGDGIDWIRPHREVEHPGGLPVGFGAYVVDDGPDAPQAGRRYKLAWENGGLFTAFSPDGLKWTPASDKPVLHDDMGDIISLSRDPIRKRYLLLCKVHSTPQDGYKGSTPNAMKDWKNPNGKF